MVLGMNGGRGGGGDHRRNPKQRRENDSSSNSRHHHHYNQGSSSTGSSHTTTTSGTTSYTQQSSTTTQQQPVVPVQQLKNKPSAEQVHIARMLTQDRTPSDIQERILQVQAVVDRPEESIVIALHDNEFDVGKACEALLDSNGSSKEEWMTMSTTKKNKKKSSQVEQKKSSSGSKGSSKAAPLSTRQNYGGNVSVTGGNPLSTEDNEKERKLSGRSRSYQSGGRGGGRGGGADRRRGDKGDRSEGGYRGRRNEGRGNNSGPSFEGRFAPRHQHRESNNDENNPGLTHEQDIIKEEPLPSNIVEESWDLDETPPQETDSIPPTGGSEEWVIVDTPPPSGVSGAFPDALGRHFYAKQQQEEASLSPLSVEVHTIDEPSEAKTTKSSKHRKFKASQIPDQPVQMPSSSVETLSYDMDMLGIGFGMEIPPVTPPITDAQSSSIEQQSSVSSNPSSFDQQTSLNHQQLSMNSSLLPSSPYADIADDPVIISSFKEKPPDNLEPPPGLVHPSQQPSSDIQSPATPTGSLLPPPPDPISLPPLTSSQAPPTSGLLSAGITSSDGGGGASGGLGSNTNSGSVLPDPSYSVMKLHSAANNTGPVTNPSSFAVSSSSSNVPLSSTGNMFPISSASATPSSVVVPPPSTGTVVPPVIPIATQQQSSLSSSLSTSSNGGGGAGGGSGSSRMQHSSTSGHSSTMTSTQLHMPTGGGGAGGKPHSTSTTSSSTSSSGNVHPMAAMYPPMLPQFHTPYGTAPVMMPPYTYDPDSMSRYQGFYGQHPTSQEQGGGASLSSGIGRGDPQSTGTSNTTGGGSGGASGGSLAFGIDSKYDGAGTTPNQSQPQQQQQGAIPQQQQQQQLNHAFYSHQFPYPMYALPMGMAAATGYSAQPMGHKPTGATSYPTGTSYQQGGASHQYPAYDDVYNLKNSQVVPTTSSSDFSSFPKHQFDNKNAFSAYNVPLGMGGYMMGHHHVPPMGTAPIMAHDQSSRSKQSHKFPGNPSWPSSTHT